MQRDNVVILGDLDSAESLAGRLLLLNYRGVPVRNLTGVLEVNARTPEPLRCILVAGGHVLEDPSPMLEPVIQSFKSQNVEFIAVGYRPDPPILAALRSAGVRSALWEPYTDEELRFVINRSHRRDATGHTRDSTRVPSHLAAWIRDHADARVALVCTLSTLGAYLMTPRPSHRGRNLKLDITFPYCQAKMDAKVVWHNAPGGSRHPNAPVGMGVRFTRVDAAAGRALRRYVATRSAQFSL